MEEINYIGKCFKKEKKFVIFTQTCEDDLVRIGHIPIDDKIKEDIKRLLSLDFKEVQVEIHIKVLGEKQ